MTLASRAAVHVATFARDAAGGWRATATTPGHPRFVAPHVTPARVAPHPAGLALAIDADVDAGVLILPAREVTERATRAAVTLLSVDPRHGGSHALTMDALAWGRLAPSVLADLASMSARTAGRELGARPIVSVAARPERRVRDLGPAARAVLGAIMTGVRVHLGPSDCRCVEDARLAIADALEALPASLRPHISIALGLTRPDAAIQVSWSASHKGVTRDATWTVAGLDPDLALSRAADRLFDTAPAAPAASLAVGVSTLSDPGPLPELRAAVAAHARRSAPGAESTTMAVPELPELSLRQCLDGAFLDAILASPERTAITARALAAPDGASLSRLVQALAVHAVLGGDLARRAERARLLLMPRDARAADATRAAGPRDLAAALDALLLEGAAPSAEEEAIIAAIARCLVTMGRADVAFEAMRALSGRLARAAALEAEPRLRLMSVVATLSASVLAAARDQTPAREEQIVPLQRTRGTRGG